MIIEATAGDFEALRKGIAPRNLRLVPDSPIAPPDVLEMLSNLADEIRPSFAPPAWLIISEDEIVGLCSIARLPQDGDIHIGYGVAPTRQGRGYTTRAIGDLLAWGRTDPRVVQISAETGVGNIASQRVLERNGFIRTGERVDAEDGPLICWRAMTVQVPILGPKMVSALGHERGTQDMPSLFHLAYHVTDLDASRRFYGDVLGCKEGRSTETWVDFDFFGHQISLHLGKPFEVTRTGKVGDHKVMMPHFGVVLPLDDWFALAGRLEKAGIVFDIPPVVRFAGEPGEQRTMFFFDPSGNPIEVKGFRDFDSVFAQ